MARQLDFENKMNKGLELIYKALNIPHPDDNPTETSNTVTHLTAAVNSPSKPPPNKRQDTKDTPLPKSHSLENATLRQNP